MLMRLDHVAGQHSKGESQHHVSGCETYVIDSVADCIRLAVRQANAHSDRINAALTRARRICHGIVV